MSPAADDGAGGASVGIPTGAADRRADGAVRRPARRPLAGRLIIVHAILAVVLIIVTLQLWLLTATMNAYLGGDEGVLLPATLASVICLGLNTGLLWYLYRLER